MTRTNASACMASAASSAALLTGVFAIEQYGGTAGLIEGNAAQMINQIEGVVIVIVYDAIVLADPAQDLDAVIGLRVSDAVEREAWTSRCTAETVQ